MLGESLATVRRHGFSKEDAEDLTQAFFAKLLERQNFAGLKQENGRFRTFLLGALKNLKCYLTMGKGEMMANDKMGTPDTHGTLNVKSVNMISTTCS